MKKLGAILLVISCLTVGLPTAQPAAGPSVRLVLLFAVDQFRYDYLTRFRTEYTGGIKRLLTDGAVFTNANLEHYPTVTAIGHATMLSGATPSVSGIIGNDWFDRETGATVTSVSDPTVQPLGAPTGSAASPRRLLVSTLGDELKMASRATKGAADAPRVFGVSLKDRSAGALDAPFLRAVSMHALGATLLAEGDARAALAALREAAAGWELAEAPYEAARTRVLIARACQQLGDVDGAGIECEAARHVFRQLGATPDLAAMDAASSAQNPASASGLSARELEVLRSLVTGKTNRAIADELCISEKTVARHISNIFNKLGLSSRTSATAYAYEHHLV
jgi:DNA-binding NarL/FixJ family response regulator